MTHIITRRDFIDGVACAFLAAQTVRAGAGPENSYPPALTGIRGSRDADLAAAHALRDGMKYAMDDHSIAEEFDCVVVGAGISGLSAAYFVRKARPAARLLVLDNHDDFGGHARRNEFQVDGRLLIGYGGSESIQSPKSQWSPAALGLLADLAIHPERFKTAINTPLYPSLGMSSAILFAREEFGVDKLVTGDPQRSLPTDIPKALHHGRSLAEFWADSPLSPEQRRLIISLYSDRRDLFPGHDRRRTQHALERMSYADFLARYWNLDETTLKIFTGRTRDLFALSADLISAWWASGSDLPGFQGVDLGKDNEMSYEREPYIYHFPDGNASIARLLVRKLVPRAANGSTMEDIVTDRVAYDELDRAGPVRIRLSSTVVQIRNTPSHVDVLYAGSTGMRRVRCQRVIYAGYGAMLPYLCTEIPSRQREALAACIRSPLVYVTVALRQWRPWVRAGAHFVYNPTGFYSTMKLDYPVSLGDYQFARSPDEPILLHLSHIPEPPVPIGDRHAHLRAARQALYGRPFSDFENAVRDEVTRAFGPSGFKATDIAAITVNRWGHGYSYDLSPLSDPDSSSTYVTAARRPVGRTSIAGADMAWAAYAHAAIDEAHRAAEETVTALGRPTRINS